MKFGHFLTVTLAFILACENDPTQPDLEAIIKDHCAIIKMCDTDNFDEAFTTSEKCETDSSEQFAKTKDSDPECYSARLTWESCTSMLDGCAKFETSCKEEFSDYYKECRLP